MHDPAVRARAEQLRKEGLLVREVAVEIGVPKATVTRWLNPEFEKRERKKALKRKYGKPSKCPRCRRKKMERSKVCRRCALELQTLNRPWNTDAIIEAIQAWAIEKGHAPTSDEWQKSGKNHPAISSITKGSPFNSWSEALTAAGFIPRQRRSGKRKYAPGELQALRRQIREQKIIEALQKENEHGHAAGVRDDAGVPDQARSQESG